MVTGATRMVVVAGQVGVRADGRVGSGVIEQTTIAMENIVAVLAEADLELAAVVSFTVHLTDDAHIGPFTEAAGGFLHEDPTQRPACTVLIHGQLANPSLLVQIESTAVG